MSLETAWLALLGLLLAGYFVLGGYDYGVQLLHPWLGERTGREADRNAALDAIAPFFLGNEVWLVAFAGVLFGAFPHLEGTLLSGLYPLIVAILVGLVLGNAAIQLRRRSRTARGRRRWDALIVFGGALPAVCWGLVVGLLLHGVPRRADGSFHVGFGDVFSPFVLACGATTTLLFAAHGAAFVALRSAPELAARARHSGLALLRAVGLVGALPLLLTLFGAGASMTNKATSAVITALFAAALGGAWWSLSGGHHVRAFTATCCATALPVLLVGLGHYPYLLISEAGHGLTVDHAVTDDATLKILSAFGVLVVPVILAYQAWSWWAFRGRTGLRHPGYF
ncbi:cytochrome d ubiquinol oxidase subunit II [Streptomyces flavofungini]|uniref:Cytochrome d ubiquinol oxidase subunit II n=1 Tax=Streptomyces flavofungini TaxID=68200 RepID=A0ABS0X963_9ACTN|nr:cytochrome d ubiquinol oxidase subunit II [Streptomyces flavofungini]MBJ3809737.1 cytochrome d ubiquinol oxidase subunit II [Streptomyces flavofungini]GHC80434.1 cytochrome c oxidase assembly protein [Streptomyces flavofungini]